MNHKTHWYLMLGLVGVGAVLFLTGSGGGALFLLWPLACMAMMGLMMWAMMRSQPGSPPHTHDVDDKTHTQS